jgi:hypothetical protein
MGGNDAGCVNQCACLPVTDNNLRAGATNERAIWAKDEADTSWIHASEPTVAQLFRDGIVAPEVAKAGVGAPDKAREVFLATAGARGIARWKAGRWELLIARRLETRKGRTRCETLRAGECGGVTIPIADVDIGVTRATRANLSQRRP